MLAVVAIGLAAAADGQMRTARCADCHPEQGRELAASAHRHAVVCQNCHGGRGAYELTAEQAQRWLFAPASGPARVPGAAFDHGPEFRGQASRSQVPERCGTCHADVELMNPYGLPTNQLAAYWLSGHGKRLKLYGDPNVAVCTDCHGTHDVLPKSDARSRTHFTNIPGTCARCHADQKLMAGYHLSADIVAQYRESIHGRNLLERQDAGSPHCATCHGSHAAAPPGFANVGHVCGQCHQQMEEHVQASVHGRIAVLAPCTGCHGPGGDPRNHRIREAAPPPEQLVATYAELRGQFGPDPQRLRPAFTEKLDQLPDALRPDYVCRYCHGPQRTGAHAEFFAQADEAVLALGQEFTQELRAAQFRYAQAADRVQQVARGVLLVKDEAVRIEDAKTGVVALYAYLHTLERAGITQRAQEIGDICQEVNASLDAKERGLVWRRWALQPAWAFVLVFGGLMYVQYRLLKRAYVRAPDQPPPPPPPPGRRRLLETTLRVLGLAAVVGLSWPAVAYILPVRKRGGAAARASAGPEAGWTPWTAHKLQLAGKPVAVVRTDAGFRAFSLICTHLGCVVHWNDADRSFFCPCHAAVFDRTGKVVSGPAPRALPEYPVAVVQGEVIVQEAAGS